MRALKSLAVSNMDELQLESSKGQALLRLLIEVHRWETLKIPVLNTVSGRELYFSMLAQLLEAQQTPDKPLKSHKGMATTKATRQRIHSFEALGLAIISPSKTDGRSKHLMPTEKFIELAKQHMAILERLHQEMS